ncbi:uncharacterized protein LOC128884334 isoform X2 [Hylaeus volcanicus]|uniref:uncharacterized protein LOC128884334 isoform X2 n=1 Tax=Hylaeus volcanicus TaxID=313075 RepID=UPI0023B84B86|nr:uncharacterized protein LOC128884334 isoform X2 [Hylaeus volcanicus]
MRDETNSMHLYHVTLQQPTAITSAVQGNFSAARVHEIVVARGRVLELLRWEDKSELRSVWSSDVFGLVRSIATFRLTGSSKDYLVVGSDSGRIVILQFNLNNNRFEKVHQETYGKSGVRRIVPGQYLAADPKGRAIMIGAIERSKFVYVMNRDASNNLTISSPLEAHKSHQICFGITGVDVGFENPVFASIEQSYESVDKVNTKKPSHDPSSLPRPPKGLSFWEMDLGLNHVIKKCTLPCDDTAHMIIPVPGGSWAHEGPSGVIVCCANYLVYKRPDHPDVSCAIPRRLEMPQDAKMFVSCYAVHRLRGFFFFLIQSDYGDIYKIEMHHEKQGEKRIVTEILCRYLDSVPVATSMCVLRSGYLFVASEFGNHNLYQFTGIGDDKTDPICSSLHPNGSECIVAFKSRKLRNLTLATQLSSLSPITDMKILDALNEGHSQIFLGCGKGPCSVLKTLKYGASVEELADNQLPGTPLAVWTLRNSLTAEHDNLIVVSFSNSTLVLSIEDTVSEVTETNFLRNTATLHVALLEDNSHVQVHQNGIRHLQTQGRVAEWRPLSGTRIVAASSNRRQVCVSLSWGEIVSFELDASNILTEVCRKTLGHEVNALSVQPIPLDRARAQFVAVSGLDNSVRLLSLDPEMELRQLALSVVPDNVHAESVCLLYVCHKSPQNTDENKTMSINCSMEQLFLFVGLETGVLLRMNVDRVTGELSDQRSRFLGPVGVRLQRVSLGNSSSIGCSDAIAVLSIRPWLCYYTAQCRLECVPMHYTKLQFVSSFSSPQCPDGFVAIAAQNLKIFQIGNLNGTFSQITIPLTYTPRKLCVLPPPAPQVDALISTNFGLPPPSNLIPPTQAVIAVVEADHDVYDEATRKEIAHALHRIKIDGVENNEESDDMEIKEDARDDGMDDSPIDDDELLQETETGTFRAGPGKWGSCIRVINPATAQTICKLALDVDEAALCCVVCRFWEFDSPCLVVGTTYNLTLRPRKCPMATIKVYAYNSDYNLTLLHSTPVEAQPLALCAWDGRLIVSLGKKLRIYALGRKRLLKKCEYRTIPEGVIWLRVVKDRIYAGDIRDGFMILKYKAAENQLQVVAEEYHPHWLSCGEVLDYHTVVGGDKFDSINVLRVAISSKDMEASSVGGNSTLRLRGDTAYLVAECPKFESVASFHLESLVYTTIMGSIGTFLPLLTKNEVDFLEHLEMAMRIAAPPLCGREHMVFRSYYTPCKGVIDGDLCEMFQTLPYSMQKQVSEELSKNPLDILKKLEELRNRVL